jgi:hypothetical protein
MLQRAIRAIRLDVDLYETVEADAGYTGEAAIIVAITSLLASIGAAFSPGDQSVIGTAIGGVIGWLIWAGLALLIGTRVFKGTSNYGEMLRVLGFASAPRAFAVVPVIGVIVGAIWALVAGVVAIRQGMDFTTGKAVGTVLIGWIVAAIVSALTGFGSIF